jgi:hypothetical protein
MAAIARLAAATVPVIAATFLMVSAASAADQESRIDPAATAALKAMSDYVTSLPAIELDATVSYDVVAKNGQTIVVSMTGHYKARRPDRLRVDLQSDTHKQSFYYDGTTFTIVAPAEGFFAKAEAKPTIRETLAAVAASHSVEMPLADLFALGTDEDPVKLITSAFDVGPSEITGIPVEHWAFRGKQRDWEVWIAAGDKPLPVKFQIVDRSDPALPRYDVVLAWVASPTVSDADFTFVPTATMKQIDFVDETTAPEGE